MNEASMPAIRRARAWRLYGLDGKRYLDLYSDGGKSILGRKNGGLGGLAKSCIDSGLVSEFPSVWTSRLEKALRSWLPGYDRAILFPSFEQARQALASALGASGLSGLRVEKAFGEYLKNAKENATSGGSGAPALAELPLPALWSFGVILAPSSLDLPLKEKLESLAGRDRVPAVKLALASKALAELSAFKAFYDEKLWSRMDSCIEGLFTRSGPWLYPAYPESAHRRVFRDCLGAGILISPDYAQPSLVPGEFDPGEIASLRPIAANAREASG